MTELPPPPTFDGWDTPHYTQIPDALFDVWLPHLSGAEVKVLLYIMRRTFGWKKDSDAISLTQITSGIVKKGGERLDSGAGVAMSTAVGALRRLAERGLIIAERQESQERGHEATIYRLRMKVPAPYSENRSSYAANHSSPSPKIEVTLLRKSETQETPSRDIEQEDIPDVPFVPLADPPHFSPYIAAVITDYAREFGELANVAAHAKQACALWQSSSLSEAAFVDALHQAKASTGKAAGRRSMAGLFERLQQGV